MNVYAYEGAWQIDHIVIVGVGGTGSALARIVARILWQRGQMGQSVPVLHLIDPDVVEEKNLMRQAFAPGEENAYKSQVIARRYSLAYGIRIQYATEPFDPDRHLPRGSILVDCTDNHEARRSIIRGVEQQNSVTLISCGNHFSVGQIILGACGDRDRLEEMISRMERDETPGVLRDGLFRPCHHLPHFALIYPELLEPEPPKSEPDLSCRDLLFTGEQHPLINDFMGTICAGYIFKLLHRQPVTTFISQIDLHNLSCTSTPILPSELRAAL